jgi:hypothetical protein
MPTDFRDGKTFPRRGREALGGFLWLARVFDKARAKANRTQDGYIYPCPMDRAVMSRWGIKPTEFTSAVAESQSDDQIVDWLSKRVTPDNVQAANTWVQAQTNSLDRQDADEGVPGAVAPRFNFRGTTVGLITAAIIIAVAWIARHVFHI